MRIFPKGPSYRFCAAAFCVLSFLIANLGLDAIIAYSMPVLMFLYPLAIVLILLTLCGKFFRQDRTVLRWTIGFTSAAAVLDLLRTLPEGTRNFFHLNGFLNRVSEMLPLMKQGFGWVCPALAGLAAGLLLYGRKKHSLSERP